MQPWTSSHSRRLSQPSMSVMEGYVAIAVKTGDPRCTAAGLALLEHCLHVLWLEQTDYNGGNDSGNAKPMPLAS